MDSKLVRDMMHLLSATMPEDALLDELEKSIREYRINKTEKSKSHLMFNAILLVSRQASGGSMGEAFRQVEQMRNRDSVVKMFDNKEQ